MFEALDQERPIYGFKREEDVAHDVLHVWLHCVHELSIF